jgi:molybdate transport system substrate-binding protein
MNVFRHLSKNGRLIGLAVVSFAAALGADTMPAQAVDVSGLAAMTLQNVIDEAASVYEHQTGTTVSFSYGSSAALVGQIDNGAPADIFISADSNWMDVAEDKTLIRAGTRVNLASSRLVLIAPRDKATPTAITPNFPIRQMLGDGRLVMCDPMMMPAGRYGRAALETLGVWKAVQDRIANADNVRAALAFVSRGEAPLGIVFDTDAAIDSGVKIVGVFPPETHPPIVYPAAIIASSEHAEAASFLVFLASAKGRAIFAKYGYSYPPSGEEGPGAK